MKHKINVGRLLEAIENENYDISQMQIEQKRTKCNWETVRMYAKSRERNRNEVWAMLEILNAESKERKAYQAARIQKKWMEKQNWERCPSTETMEKLERYIFEKERELEYAWVTSYLYTAKKHNNGTKTRIKIKEIK